MFTRSALSTLAAIASLACGSSAVAETFGPSAALLGSIVRQAPSPSSSSALGGDPLPVSSLGRAPIEQALPHASPWRSALAAPWSGSPTAGDARARTKLSFDRESDDTRAGSSTSITLGRLNPNDSRGGPAALTGMSQVDLERELAQLRDGVNRVRTMPQVSLGMHVKF
jgi:hypothetical protein